MRKLFAIGVLLLGSLAVVPGSALGTEPNNESATYEFELEEPNVAKASNGDTITVTGAGHFAVHPKSASGGGGFTHTFAGGGSASGTWTVTGLVSFTPYGCGIVFGIDIPDNLCGGQLILRVRLVPTANPSVSIPGTLWITCLIGPKVPGGAQEGIRLNVRGLNFNKEVSGTNVFIKE